MNILKYIQVFTDIFEQSSYVTHGLIFWPIASTQEYSGLWSTPFLPEGTFVNGLT